MSVKFIIYQSNDIRSEHSVSTEATLDDLKIDGTGFTITAYYSYPLLIACQ